MDLGSQSIAEINEWIAVKASPTSFYENISADDLYLKIVPRWAPGVKKNEAVDVKGGAADPLQARKEAKKDGKSAKKGDGEIEYNPKKHNIALCSRKQPDAEMLHFTTPVSSVGFCMLQHGTGTKNPDKKDLSEMDMKSLQKNSGGVLKLSLTSKPVDEATDEFGRSTTFCANRLKHLEIEDIFLKKLMGINAISDAVNIRKRLMEQRKGQLEAGIAEDEELFKDEPTEAVKKRIAKKKAQLAKLVISDDEVVAELIKGGAVTDRFTRDKDDEHGLVVYFETSAFRDRTADDKYVPQWRYKDAASKKLMLDNPATTEDEAIRLGWLVEDKDIRSFYYDDNKVYTPFKIRTMPHMDANGKLVPSEDLPYRMRDMLGSALMSVTYVYDTIVDANGYTSLKMIPKEGLYVRGWQPTSAAASSSSRAMNGGPTFNLDEPFDPAAARKRKQRSPEEQGSAFSIV